MAANHPAAAERNKHLGIGANIIDNRQFLFACVTTWRKPGVMGSRDVDRWGLLAFAKRYWP